jgi:hypothetical protein
VRGDVTRISIGSERASRACGVYLNVQAFHATIAVMVTARDKA